MKPKKLYKVSLHEMSEQTNKFGQTIMDANGDPLRSVQVRQSPEQKREMLEWMMQLAKLYKDFPDLFPEGKHQVGNDPIAYTVKEMMEDLLERVDTWRMLSSAHIYKSFIDRHNWLLDYVIGQVHAEDMYDEVQYMMENYPIRFWTSRQQRMQESIRKSGLWTIK